jgi:hypothetical protein
MRAVHGLVFGVALPVFGLMALPTQAQNNSSYQLTCSNIYVEGAVLHADCRRMDGSFHHTAIAIQGIANIDGVLRFQGFGQPSSYQATCGDIRVRGDVLLANCRRMDGSWNRSERAIPGIANIDGNLQYQ